MAVSDISVVNSSFMISVGSAVYKIDHFSPESDMWVVDDIETGHIERTPDGKILGHTSQAVINASLTISGASEIGEVLRQLLVAQIRDGNNLAVTTDISVVIENNGNIETYSNGRLSSGGAGFNYGNEKLGDQTFTFQFGNRSFQGSLGLMI